VGQAAMGLSPQPAAAVTAATVTLHITHTNTTSPQQSKPKFPNKKQLSNTFFFFFYIKKYFQSNLHINLD
jgi:hypothetical protein